MTREFPYVFSSDYFVKSVKSLSGAGASTSACMFYRHKSIEADQYGRGNRSGQA